MKKLVMAFTVLGLLSVSVSAHAACGTNAGRRTDTRAPSSPSSNGNGGNAGTASGAGMDRGSSLPN